MLFRQRSALALTIESARAFTSSRRTFPSRVIETSFDATNAAVDRMLDAGAYVGVASHDLPVIDHALSALKSHGMGPGIEDPRSNAGTARHHKGRDTNSSCSWASVVRFAVACSRKAIGRGSTSRTVRSGTNTASVGCKRTPPLAHKWPRRSCSLDKPSLITFFSSF